jgi:hypothetical protein
VVGKGCRVKTHEEVPAGSIFIPLKDQSDPAFFRFAVKKNGKKIVQEGVMLDTYLTDKEHSFFKNSWEVISELAALTGVSTEYKNAEEKKAVITAVKQNIWTYKYDKETIKKLKEKMPTRKFLFVPRKDLYGFTNFNFTYGSRNIRDIPIDAVYFKKGLRVNLDLMAEVMGIPKATRDKMKKKELADLVYSKFCFET